jgi:hypothetical protein
MLISAYRQHPRPYVYRPINMAPISVVSRARDAMRGCLTFRYPIEHDDISHEDLMRWYSEVIFKFDDEQVYIGTSEKVNSVLTGTESVSDSTLRFTTLELEDITAFEVLLSRGRLVGPIMIQRPPDLTLLPTRENVERLNRPDGSLVLI